MDTSELLENQIENQIENSAFIEIEFLDSRNDKIILYEQGENGCFIKPLFKRPKMITKSLFLEIVNNSSVINENPGEKEYYYKSGLTYDDFFDKFYNK